MIEYVGRRTVGDEARNWGDYFGEADARAQARWQNAETRARYDEAARYNRAEGSRLAQFTEANAHLFDDRSADFAGMGSRPTPAPVASRAGLQAEPSATPAAPGGAPAQTPAQAPARNVNLRGLPWPAGEAQRPGAVQPEPPLDLSQVYRPGHGSSVEFTPEQRRQYYERYVAVVRAYNNGQATDEALQQAREAARVSGAIAGTADIEHPYLRQQRLQPHPPTRQTLSPRQQREYDNYVRAVEQYNNGNIHERYLANARNQAINAGALPASARTRSEQAPQGESFDFRQTAGVTPAPAATGAAPNFSTAEGLADFNRRMGLNLGPQVRSQAEQNDLLRRGVTNTAASYHTTGQAVDIPSRDIGNLRGDAAVAEVQRRWTEAGYDPNADFIWEDGQTAGTGPHVHVEPRGAGGAPQTQMAGLQEEQAYDPRNDPDYTPVGDLSRPMELGPELQLAAANIQNLFQRAQLAAQHGNLQVADEAFASALQHQAEYITQSRMPLLQAASSGNMQALANLVEDFNDYPEGTVQFTQVGDRWRMEVQNENGQWEPAEETPHTLDEWLSSMQNLVDVEGAAARTEANTEMARARLDANTRLQVASMEQRTAVLRMISEQETALLTQRAQYMIAQNRFQIAQDQENGGFYVVYRDTDDQGNSVVVSERVWTNEEQTPRTPGSRRETVQVPRSARTTGTVGLNVGAD